MVEVTSLRNPCGRIDGFRAGLLRAVLGRDAGSDRAHRAGITGVARVGGLVRPGDPIRAEPPPGPHRKLERM